MATIKPIQSIELNFDPDSYDTAQSALFEQLGKLQDARSRYEALKNKIGNFWTGEEAENAKNAIQANIDVVDKSYENVKKQQETYKNANSEATQKRTEFNAAVTEAKDAVKALFT